MAFASMMFNVEFVTGGGEKVLKLNMHCFPFKVRQSSLLRS
jgi:hypothetical protein